MASEKEDGGMGPPQQKTAGLTEAASPSGSSLTRREIEIVRSSHLSGAHVKGMTGCCMASVTDGNTACTAAEDRMCKLFKQLATWNEWLLPALLQLREITGARPQLSLVTRRVSDFPEPQLELMQKALTCARWVLKTHQCIVALDLSLVGRLETWEDLFFEALKGSSSVKYLKIKSNNAPRCSKTLCRFVLSMKGLEELEIENEEGTSQLQSALSSLLHSAVSLGVFRIPRLKVHGDVSVLLGALCANSTVTELSLNDHVLSRADEGGRYAFAKYLEKSVTLTTFSYFGDNGPSRESSLSSVIYGLLRNKSIRNLSLTDFLLDCGSDPLISKLIETTQSVRRFKMISMKVYLVADCCDLQDNHSRWLLALAGSKALEEVTLSIRLCSGPVWRWFLETLSSNAHTMKVIIEAYLGSQDVLVEVCKAIRESSMDDRVSLSKGAWVENLEILKCKALSQAGVRPQMGGNREHWPVLQELSSCSHLTSVCLNIKWPEDTALFTAIAAYVVTTTTLKELAVHTICPLVPRGKDFRCWEILSSSLTRNKSIREVGIHALWLDAKSSELIADTVKCRKNTWGVQLRPGTSETLSAFIRRLSMGIAHNFTILNVTLHFPIQKEAMGNWFEVDKTVRRNSGLLTRAAQFAAGAIRDRCGAEALERVHRHPALPEELMQAVSVESAEAAFMIRRGLRTIESIHDFMRLSGVVKERVVCLPCKDGRPQLDDLDEYCWGAVRRYLLLEDVRCYGRP